MPTVASVASSPFFPGFEPLREEVADVTFSGVVGGSGTPVLLLHGYPQTHVAWRHVAPRLAERFTVVVPDLPGYGGSRTHGRYPRWTKRRVAGAMVALMQRLGHTRFAVVGHDRGGRVGYRLALDHPDSVSHLASLTVVPTLDAWDAMDRDRGLASFHWYFLAQPFDLPETLLAAAPDAFIDAALARMTGDLAAVEPRALTAYRDAFRDRAVRHAMCEDYRAATAEDLDADAADRAAHRTMACPVLMLWPTSQNATSPMERWRRWATDVTGTSLPGNHLLPESSPNEVLDELLPFLSQLDRPSLLRGRS